MGSTKVGKTELVMKLTSKGDNQTKVMKQNSIGTGLGEKIIEIDNVNVLAEIWDSFGQE